MSKKSKKLKDQIEEMGKPAKSKGESSTHYIRFEGESDIDLWNNLCDMVGISRSSPESLKKTLLSFVGSHLEVFKAFIGKPSDAINEVADELDVNPSDTDELINSAFDDIGGGSD